MTRITKKKKKMKNSVGIFENVVRCNKFVVSVFIYELNNNNRQNQLMLMLLTF